MAADSARQLLELGVALLVADAVAEAVAEATADGVLERARFFFFALIALVLVLPLVAEALLVGDEGLDTPAPPEAEIGLVGDDELLGGALGSDVVGVGVGVGVGVDVADCASTGGACSVTVTVTVLGMGDGAAVAVAVAVDGLDDGAVGSVDAPLGLAGRVGTTPPIEVEGATDGVVPGIVVGSGRTGASGLTTGPPVDGETKRGLVMLVDRRTASLDRGTFLVAVCVTWVDLEADVVVAALSGLTTRDRIGTSLPIMAAATPLPRKVAAMATTAMALVPWIVTARTAGRRGVAMLSGSTSESVPCAGRQVMGGPIFAASASIPAVHPPRIRASGSDPVYWRSPSSSRSVSSSRYSRIGSDGCGTALTRRPPG